MILAVRVDVVELMEVIFIWMIILVFVITVMADGVGGACILMYHLQFMFIIYKELKVQNIKRFCDDRDKHNSHYNPL